MIYFIENILPALVGIPFGTACLLGGLICGVRDTNEYFSSIAPVEAPASGKHNPDPGQHKKPGEVDNHFLFEGGTGNPRLAKDLHEFYTLKKKAKK